MSIVKSLSVGDGPSERKENSSNETTPRRPNVRILVLGGVVQSVEILDGTPVTIEVIDYDTDGIDEEPLDRDDEGDVCVRYIA